MRRRLALTAVGAAVLAMAGGIVVSVATAAPASATPAAQGDRTALYVMRNQFNQIVRIELGRNYASGQVTGTITDPNFDTPTTIAAWGPFLYAVNARLTTPPNPTTAYTVVRVP